MKCLTWWKMKKESLRKKYSIVKVVWEDATTLSSWQPKEAIGKIECSVFVTCGILLENNKKRVAVCLTSNHMASSDVLLIPRGCVKSIKKLCEVELEE